MATEQPGLGISLEAAATLATKQYHFVKLDNTGKAAAIAAETDRPVGVAQDGVDAAGKVEGVMVDGITKLVAGEAIAAGDFIGPNAAGRAQVMVPGTDTTKYICGQALTAGGADGVVFSALINCATPARGA